MDVELKESMQTTQPLTTEKVLSYRSDTASEWQADKVTQTVMLQVGSMINAKFKALEKRLLPTQQLESLPESIVATTNGQSKVTEQNVQSIPPTENTKKGKKNKKKKSVVATALASTKPSQVSEIPLGQIQPSTTNPTPSQEWITVGKRGKNKKVSEQAKNVSGRTQSRQSRAVKLQAPRSTAEVITLQPGAEKRGVTYAKILTEAKSKIDLSELGIKALRFRRAATGARILEIPGVTSGEKADCLAGKLKASLNEEDVRVARPTKCAELRISGLDESVSVEEVAAAVVRDGECSSESIKVGEIREDSSGQNTVWVRCPVKVAKKLANNGRIKIGWAAGQVKLLEPRPMQCFRCLENGHVAAQCKALIDRSNECFRCGQNGHKARQCTATPHCNLCAVATKPAEHKMGSKACVASVTNKRREKTANGTKTPLQLIQPSTTNADDQEVILTKIL